MAEMTISEDLANVEVWSASEFGGADLGNKRRVERLVLMAQRAANQPAGRVTQVFKASAELQGAYKFLENRKVNDAAIGLAANVACAQRCAGESHVFVPVDGSSLSLSDPKQAKQGLGPVGNRSKKGRGLEVMNAIAVRIDGTPLGLLGQAYWARDEKENPRPSKKRSLAEKETRFWFTAMNQSMEAMLIAKSTCIPWFQLDRGGDFGELLRWAAEASVLLTVRAAQDRRVLDADTKYLWDTVEACEIAGQYTLQVAAGPKRRAREATMEVRFCPVTFRLPNPETGRNEPMQLYAVQTREVGTTPAGEGPIEWMLLTNFQVKRFTDACLVVYGYAQRWRVEDFHKTWKSVCKIEESLLEESSRVIKWATIMAAVAMRIDRLKHLARTSPDIPATAELTQDEIDATIILREPKGYKLGQIPSISLVVRWLADLGGYTGKSSGGPPGSITIGRGLKEIALLARYLPTLERHLLERIGKK